MVKDRKIRLNNKMNTRQVLEAEVTNFIMEHAYLSKEIAAIVIKKVPMMCFEIAEHPDALGRYHLVDNDSLRAFCIGTVAYRDAILQVKYDLKV